ncbi:RHS repeat-associated core domain-containing protein [Pseudomonas chlororaphis]|uniref:RHS repeat-associated core domain-containing protein n=1 Tax=Pseudomonas chlororaphis TaxID=587753 RepID=UPI0015E02C06|nr:RHS repeat-associated core domain-containing protein [Pseudomonas chlororaphis]QLL13731.1 RHS repeat protein [Pseudomonas chlororaphis subsp. aurantiaca]
MDRIAVIEQQLDTFKNSLTRYHEQLRDWYAQASQDLLFKRSRPSLLAMEAVIGYSGSRLTDFESPLLYIARCPLEEPLLIESKLKSTYDIPLGGIQVEVVSLLGVTQATLTLDEEGKGRFQGTPGEYYKIRVHNDVTPADVDALFKVYDKLGNALESWLREEWAGFKPQWPKQSVYTWLHPAQMGIFAGDRETINGVWRRIRWILNILKDPKGHSIRLEDEAQSLTKLAETRPDAMKRAMLLASDEAALFLLVRSASIWLSALPPTQYTHTTALTISSNIISALIDMVLAVVLNIASSGLGDSYLNRRLNARGDFNAVNDFLAAVCATTDSYIEQLAQYTTVAARGVTTLAKNGLVKLYFDGKRNSRLNSPSVLPDASSPATTPDQQINDAASNTCTNGCPVSMVTGEELLTLTDGELDGLLPFKWTRLYRTSAAEIDCGLGHGWSHALAQRLEIHGDSVVWTDHENRSTTFPLPDKQCPAITNTLSRAAIFRGDDPAELILSQAGETVQLFHFRYNSQGATLVAISDAYDNRLHITRDIQGRIKRLDNGAGRALLLRYDRTHIVAVDYQQFLPADTLEDSWSTLKTLVSYRYDAQHRLVEARNAAGEAEHYLYNEQHVILERQLAGGASFYWEWERQGKHSRCVRHWASFAQVSQRYVWDDQGGVTVVYADGSEETYTHDGQARLIRKVDPTGAEHLKAYDDKGRLIAEQDPLGAITEYHYDEAGQQIAVIAPEDEPITYEYENGLVSEIHCGQASWAYEYNAQGDITRQTDPDGHTTRYSYDRQGRLLEIRYPDESQHRLGWNNLGQLLEEQLPDGGQRKYRYDALGRQITRQDERGAITQYQWDAANRLSLITLPGGATRAFSYNAYGKVTGERDELGRITHYEYADGLHLVSRRINADGSQRNYRYDSARLWLTEIENERGEQYRLDYYPNGLLQQETSFDGRRTAYAYDLNGNLLKKTEFGDDGSELVTEYQRDAAGRLLVKTLADGEKVHYSYDTLGRLVGVDDGHWPLAYEYDLQDRLIAEHQGWGTLRYQYDTLGQLSRYRLPDGSRLDYHYQPGGQLSGIDLNGSRLTRHQYSAGLEQQRQQGLLLSHYQYDDQGRLLAHNVSQQNQNLLKRRYSYDANGNLAGIDDSRKGKHRYQYDPLDRLIHVRGNTPESFAHDPAGNLLGGGDHPVTDQANIKGNRLLMQGDRHFDYDAFGNLSRERRGTGQKLITEYRYDCQHRLIGVSLPGGSTATYQYDAFGRRIAKTVDGRTTEFLWQGERLIAESAENRYRSYLYEPDTFRPLAMLDGEGPLKAEPFYYQLDHLGTPQELTDYSGEIMWSARYRAYGNLAVLDIEEIDNPLRFQGQYFDAETGLHYNRHRYYNPGIGRFLTPDPIKLAGGLNSYQYVPSPTGWVDPLGLMSLTGFTTKKVLPGLVGKVIPLSSTLNGKRAEIIEALADVVQPHIKAINQLDGYSLVGFRGSLARGRKGPHKFNAPFNPSDFDVDAFIVSDELAANFAKRHPFRSGNRIVKVSEIQKEIDKALRQRLEFSGLRDERFTFRIFTHKEIERLQEKGDFQLFFIKQGKQHENRSL